MLGRSPYSVLTYLRLFWHCRLWRLLLGWLAGAGSPCRKRVALGRGGARHIAAFIMAMRKMVRIELRVDGHARSRCAAHPSISFSQGCAATEPGIPRVLSHRGQEVLQNPSASRPAGMPASVNTCRRHFREPRGSRM